MCRVVYFSLDVYFSAMKLTDLLYAPADCHPGVRHLPDETSTKRAYTYL